jgi:hypothetical protein
LFISAGAGVLELLATKTLNDAVRTIKRVVMIDPGVDEEMAEDVIKMFESEFVVDQNIQVDYYYGLNAYVDATEALKLLPLTFLVSGAINEGRSYTNPDKIIDALKSEFDFFWQLLVDVQENSGVSYVSAYVSFEDTFTLEVSTLSEQLRKARRMYQHFARSPSTG